MKNRDALLLRVVGAMHSVCRPALLCASVLLLLLTGCSPKKNTAASRNYQAFITRYNIYYNGDEHYRETLKAMEDKYEDDYSRRLMVHPVEAYGLPDASPSTEFNRSIEKAQKAIQLRSIKKRPARKSGKGSNPEYREWLKREEYNPFLHNAWMMMGRSQYFNGDFLGAASTFHYVEKHFKWLPATVTEALIWQARCYVSAGWLYDAETLMERIKPEELTDKRLKGLYDLTRTAWLLKEGRTADAIVTLRESISAAKGSQKTRLTFLLGQLLAETGQKEAAYKEFRKVASSHSASYRTRFNARIKQSEVYSGSDIEPEVRALRRMLHYGSNNEYQDQIYYAIGNLYLSRRDTTKAIENYLLAESRSTRNGIDKALAQLTLGGLYFDQGRYDLAQPRYSEAIPQLSTDFPDYRNLKRRSDVLDELAVYAGNVALQDSLLALADMTPEQQMEIIERLIRELKKREKEEADEARRAAHAAETGDNDNGLQGNTQQATEFSMSNDRSWYFYNPQLRQRGKTDFQKRWGARKLEDNWRRRNKAAFSFNDAVSPDGDDATDDDTDTQDRDDTGTDTGTDAAVADRENDPHYPEYYLRSIPANEEERRIAHEVIQEGRYNMGMILKDKLEDYPAAQHQFDLLMNTYPDNIYRADVYHNLYLMYMRLGDTARAEHYRQLILSEFADSPIGMAMRDPDYIGKMIGMQQRQNQLYALTYQAYLDDDPHMVHALADTMRADYPLSPVMPKFMFLDALAYVGQNRPDQFAATLRELIERYPDADVSPLAGGYLQQYNRGRELNSGATHRSMIWDTRLTNDTMPDINTDAPLEFDLEDPGEQLLVLIYPNDSVSPNGLLYEVARFNFNTFVVRDYDLEQMNFGNLGVLVIKGFPNMADLLHYRRTFEGSEGPQLPPQVMPVVISRKNFEMLLSRGRSFEEYFRAVNDAALRRTHEQTLDPEEYPAAEEMYQTDSEDSEQEPEQEPEQQPEPKPEPAPDEQ